MDDKIRRQFSCVKPCKNCSFRNDDEAVMLSDGRAKGIVDDLISGKATTFHCHKTIDYSIGDGDGITRDTNELFNRKHCAGALAVALKQGGMPQVVAAGITFGYIAASHYDEAQELTIDYKDLSACEA